MTNVIHSIPIWLEQTQTWLYNQIRYLPQDIHAHVVCERTENLDQFEVPNIHCLNGRPAWLRRWDRGLRATGLRRHLTFPIEIACRERADIIHSHFGNNGWRDMEMARRAGAKHVVSFYGLDVNFLPRRNPLWRLRYRTLFDRVDAVQCEGPHMAKCISALGCPEAKIGVQRLGVALDDIPFQPCDWEPGQPFRVLIAASFREKKGIPYALQAIAALRDRVPLEVTLIGEAGTDRRAQAERRQIMATIERCRLGGTVRLLGYQPHARLLLEARQHHVFLSPSITAADGDTEGGAPVSLIEMTASGLIPVSTFHCDIPEIVKHKETGLLAGERDVDGLVRNLEWLVKNPEAWCGMRRAGRRHVESVFDVKSQGERLAEIYRSLLQRDASSARCQ